MTRKDIEMDYRVDAVTGRIHSPGKFEGEMLYMPYVYECMLNGDVDEEVDETEDNESRYFVFVVQDAEREMFAPYLDEVKEVTFIEREDGFVQEF
jgi:hypothetical protein